MFLNTCKPVIRSGIEYHRFFVSGSFHPGIDCNRKSYPLRFRTAIDSHRFSFPVRFRCEIDSHRVSQSVSFGPSIDSHSFSSPVCFRCKIDNPMFFPYADPKKRCMNGLFAGTASIRKSSLSHFGREAVFRGFSLLPHRSPRCQNRGFAIASHLYQNRLFAMSCHTQISCIPLPSRLYSANSGRRPCKSRQKMTKKA